MNAFVYMSVQLAYETLRTGNLSYFFTLYRA